jgi:hypothetical protein
MARFFAILPGLASGEAANLGNEKRFPVFPEPIRQLDSSGELGIPCDSPPKAEYYGA